MVQRTLDLYPQDSDILEVRKSIAKKNSGVYYSNLTAILLGGEPTPKARGYHTALKQGGLRNGSVDVVSKNGDLIEVKSGAKTDPRPFFTVEQIRNHFQDYLTCLCNENKSEIDLKLVHYISSSDNNPPFLFGHSHPGFVRKLSADTYSSIILPSNLFFAYLLTLKDKKLDQSSTKAPSRCNLKYRGERKLTRALHEIDNSIEIIYSFLTEEERGPSISIEIIKRLKLEQLICENLSSDNLRHDIRFRVVDKREKEHRYKVRPFKIRNFSLPDSARKEWVEDLKQNHLFWLQEVLGVRDLYYEENEAPESYEVPDHFMTEQDKLNQEIIQEEVF